MSSFEEAFNKVLKFLTYRPRSEKEIRDYLVRKNIDQETQEKIWEKLRHLHLVDDKVFAEWWIGQRSGGRPKGKRVLAMELREKGIDKELSGELLAISREPSAEILLAEKVAKKQLAKFKNLPFFEIKKKLYGVLAGRGFDYETIEEVVAKIEKKE